MKVKEVIVLDDASEDLEAGKAFYDEREFGIGDYFIGLPSFRLNVAQALRRHT